MQELTELELEKLVAAKIESNAKLRELCKKLFAENNRCFYCNNKMKALATDLNQSHGHGQYATAEHLIKKCDGGTNVPENIVLACGRCNSGRGDYPVDVWKKICTEKHICVVIHRLYHPGKTADAKRGTRSSGVKHEYFYVTKEKIELFHKKVGAIIRERFSSRWNDFYSKLKEFDRIVMS